MVTATRSRSRSRAAAAILDIDRAVEETRPANVPPADEVAPNLAQGVDELFSAQVSETANDLVNRCSKVRIRRSWFPTSAKIDDTVMAEMTHMSVASVKQISASKRLMKSKHPALVAAKEAFKAINDYVISMTIPLVAVQGMSETEGIRKDGGVRVIRKDDMASFDSRMRYLVGVLDSAIARLQLAMPAIIAEDRERLRATSEELFNENDYPTNLSALVQVIWSFEPTGVDIDWKTLCPEIYERERLAVKKKYEAVVECAATEFAGRLVQYVKQVLDQIGNRTRLNPVSGFGVQNLVVGDAAIPCSVVDAEVVKLLRHEHEPEEIPEGFVLAELRVQNEKGKSTVAWLAAPMSDTEFHTKLRPIESTERKKLFASTVDNLRTELQAFANIGEMLGPYQAIVAESVTKIKQLLTRASPNLDSERIATALRNESFFRGEMQTLLTNVAVTVENQMTSAKAGRRRIDRKLMGKM